MQFIQQNEPVSQRRQIFVQMVEAANVTAPLSGLTLTVQIVKPAGAQYVASAATVVEVGSGTYRIELGTADIDTVGSVMLKVTAPGAANQYVPLQVVRFLDEIHLAKAALCNARSHAVETGVNQIKDDDGTTVLRTFTPNETNGTVTVSVS